MISAEAPVLFAKAAEIFITEISLRAWIHTEDNKRRTLQRNDIAMAITKYDQFDFLIDIVPRDELKPAVKRPQPGVGQVGGVTLAADVAGSTASPEVQYYFQLAQQHQASIQQQGVNAQAQQIQILQPNALQGVGPGQFTIANQPQLVQVQVPNTGQGTDNGQNTSTNAASQGQIIQLQQPSNANQQIMLTNGDGNQQLIQLTPQQLQQLRIQLQGQAVNQPIILQTAPSSQTGAPQYQIATNAAGQFITQAIVSNPSGTSSNDEANEQLEDASD